MAVLWSNNGSVILIGVRKNSREMLCQFQTFHLPYHTKNSDFQKDIGTKQDKNHCFHCYRCLPIPFLRITTHTQLQECFSFSLIQRVKEKVHLSGTDCDFSRSYHKKSIHFPLFEFLPWSILLGNWQEKLCTGTVTKVVFLFI